MFLSKIFDSLQVSVLVGQSEWSVTSLVDWLCGRPHALVHYSAFV